MKNCLDCIKYLNVCSDLINVECINCKIEQKNQRIDNFLSIIFKVCLFLIGLCLGMLME